MGEDVANTQFATLLKGGKSYKEYVENEIKAIKDKQQAGTPVSYTHLIRKQSNYSGTQHDND